MNGMNNKSSIVFQSALCIHGFHIHRFNQPQIKKISGKSYIVANMYCLVRGAMVAPVLNTYRLFFLVIIP